MSFIFSRQVEAGLSNFHGLPSCGFGAQERFATRMEQVWTSISCCCCWQEKKFAGKFSFFSNRFFRIVAAPERICKIFLRKLLNSIEPTRTRDSFGTLFP